MADEFEIWRDVPEYEGYYQVSSIGRVKSLTRIVVRGTNKLTISERILVPAIAGTSGYLGVSLWKDGKGRTVLIHQLVILSFIGPPPDGQEARHKDDDRLNNKLYNLEYGTHKQNGLDASINGVLIRGSARINAKLTEDQVITIMELLDRGLTQQSIADKYGVSQQRISSIKSGRSWGWLTGVKFGA